MLARMSLSKLRVNLDGNLTQLDSALSGSTLASPTTQVDGSTLRQRCATTSILLSELWKPSSSVWERVAAATTLSLESVCASPTARALEALNQSVLGEHCDPYYSFPMLISNR